MECSDLCGRESLNCITLIDLYYSELYSDAIDPTARFPRERYRLVYEEVTRRSDSADIPWASILSPRMASREELLHVHAESYIDAFLNGTLSDQEIRRIGFRPWTENFVNRTLTITGGSIEALETVCTTDKKMAGNLAGGTHHAFKDHGEGYCVFNDIAICAELAKRKYSVERILVIDLDVHQGNGTAAIFANDPNVFTFSMHGEKNFPFRKQKSDLDIELKDNTTDSTYLELLADSLEKVLKMNPELVFYQAGCDSLASDTLGRLSLSRQALQKRNEMVFNALRGSQNIVVLMGGGYAKPIINSVLCHADVFDQASRYT